MNNGLLETAAKNFDAAQILTGATQQQRIALGLVQVARAAKGSQRDNGLLETAARNFDAAQMLTGPAQVQRIALGLVQFARALKH
jgi:hypothetical protein